MITKKRKIILTDFVNKHSLFSLGPFLANLIFLNVVIWLIM